VEEMAGHYLTAVRTVQPYGPYLLGGWSMGGIIAYEMAQQLRAQGESTAWLALIDTHVENSHQSEITDERDLALSFALDLGLSFDFNGLLLPQEQLSPPSPLSSEEKLAYIVTQAKQAGIFPPDMELSQVQHLFELFTNNVHASERYRPSVYPGPVTLFKAREYLSAPPSDDETLGWKAFVSHLTIQDIPGNHFTMMRAANIQILGESLAAYIRSSS
jgi:thioesterase domain-containing protein